MTTYINHYAQTCTQCQRATLTRKYTSKLQPFTTGYPGILVHLDYTKGSGVTKRGNTHILAVIDNFAGHVKLFTTPQPTAQNVARC